MNRGPTLATVYISSIEQQPVSLIWLWSPTILIQHLLWSIECIRVSGEVVYLELGLVLDCRHQSTSIHEMFGVRMQLEICCISITESPVAPLVYFDLQCSLAQRLLGCRCHTRSIQLQSTGKPLCAALTCNIKGNRRAYIVLMQICLPIQQPANSQRNCDAN